MRVLRQALRRSQIPVPTAPLTIGFRLEGPLIAGGSYTHEAYYEREDRQLADAIVALKYLREDAPHFDLALTLLRREARVGLTVIHPNLVRLRTDHTIVKPYFITMDLLRGEPLRSILKRRRTLRINTALWIARQVAEALAALHKIGHVHGDVKPENVRLTDSRTAVLIDLGYAHKPG